MMGSVQTLLWIALDRYIAILHPLYYIKYPKQLIIDSHIWIYTISIILATPASLHYSIVNETCQGHSIFPDDYFEVHVKIYSMCWYLFIYFGPIILFIVIYYKIIVFINKISKENGNQRIKRSSMTFTITAIAITIQFMLFTTLDSSYYLALSYDIIKTPYDSTVLNVGILLFLISCSINPIICMITMKIRRRICINVFCSCFKRQSLDTKVYPNNIL